MKNSLNWESPVLLFCFSKRLVIRTFISTHLMRRYFEWWLKALSNFNFVLDKKCFVRADRLRSSLLDVNEKYPFYRCIHRSYQRGPPGKNIRVISKSHCYFHSCHFTELLNLMNSKWKLLEFIKFKNSVKWHEWK